MSWRFSNFVSIHAGKRCLLTLLLFVSVILTISFGVSNDFITGFIVRLIAGIASVPQLMIKRILKELSSSCSEKYHQVTYVATIVQTLGFGAGILIGGTTSLISIQDESNISLFINSHPFLIPSLIVSLLEIITVMWVSVHFQESPVSIPPKTTNIQTKNEPKKTGKYVELAETKKNEEIKEDGPVTERKENEEEEEEEEELPSYLQVSAIDLMPVNSDENRYKPQYFSPRENPIKNLPSKWPMSARNRIGKVFHIDNELNNEEIMLEEEQNNEPEKTGPIQNVKHTHISFVEEDFDGPTEEDHQSGRIIDLDDTFKRDKEGLSKSKPFRYAIIN